MNGAGRRNKGQRGERELANLLSQRFGFPVERDLTQVRSGGADILDVPGLSIEVKRQEALKLRDWWNQAVTQMREGVSFPVLAYRQNRKPWMFILPFSVISPGDGATDWCTEFDYTIHMGEQAFCKWYLREYLPQIEAARRWMVAPPVADEGDWDE